METNQERTIRYLSDAHAAEGGFEELLDGFRSDGNNPDLSALYNTWLTNTGDHKRTLEARMKELGANPSGAKGFINAFLAKAGDWMNMGHDENDRRVQNLVKTYSTAHLKRGMYESLMAYSMSVGDANTEAIAKKLKFEAEEMASQFFPLIGNFASGVILEQPVPTTSAYTA